MENCARPWFLFRSDIASDPQSELHIQPFCPFNAINLEWEQLRVIWSHFLYLPHSTVRSQSCKWPQNKKKYQRFLINKIFTSPFQTNVIRAREVILAGGNTVYFRLCLFSPYLSKSSFVSGSSVRRLLSEAIRYGDLTKIPLKIILFRLVSENGLIRSLQSSRSSMTD